MTLDEGIDLADLMLRLRREVAGIARTIDVTSATFTVEWRAALEELQARLAVLAHYEQQLAPILAPPDGERFTLEQWRAWLVRMAHPDEEGRQGVPAAPAPRTLHRSVH